MKRLALLLILMFIAVPAFSATIEVIETSSEVVSLYPVETQVRFDITDAVAAGVTQVFKLRIPVTKGYIRDMTYSSTSDNCTVWFSESEALAATPNLARLKFTVNTYYYSPSSSSFPRHFANRDDEYCIYGTIDNGVGAISTGSAADNATKIIITVGSK